jgi:hypothetical protein
VLRESNDNDEKSKAGARIVRTGRGEVQPADKERAQQSSRLETGSNEKPAAPATSPRKSGHS